MGRALLVLVLLSTIASFVTCIPLRCQDRRTDQLTRITIPSCCSGSNSPCGGALANSRAAVCYFRRSSNSLKCIKGCKYQECTTQPPQETDDTKYGGPTPYGEYLIGNRYSHSSYGIDWYNLYPKKEDNSGYYPYSQPTQTGRKTMGLHPGSVSLGCVTVKVNSGTSCWNKIRGILDSGSLTYKRSTYSGILYVI